MARKHPPVIGQWYQEVSPGDARFQVLAVQQDEDVIVLRHDTGELDELDRQSWKQLVLAEIDPPENQAGNPTLVPPKNLQRKP
jgi:hypothetical protein